MITQNGRWIMIVERRDIEFNDGDNSRNIRDKSTKTEI